MSIARVGVAGTVQSAGSGSAGAPTYPQTPTAGSLLTLMVSAQGTNNTLPTLTGGTGWSVAVQRALSTAFGSVSIWYKLATGGDSAPGVAAVTGSIWNSVLDEWSGWDGNAPITASATGITTPQVATVASIDAAIGALMAACGSVRISAPATNTMVHTFNNATKSETTNGATSSGNHYDFGYGITTANASADSDSFAFGTTNINGAGVALAVFAPALPKSLVYDTRRVLRNSLLRR